MKQIMMGLALAMFVAGAANAQDAQQKTKADRAEMRTERMVKELGLDADQAKKVQEINDRYGAKMETMRDQRRAEMEAKHDKQDALKKDYQEEMKAVLTPEQFAKWEAHQAELKAKQMERRKEQMQQRRGERDGMQMRKHNGMQKQGKDEPVKPAMREKAK